MNQQNYQKFKINIHKKKKMINLLSYIVYKFICQEAEEKFIRGNVCGLQHN